MIFSPSSSINNTRYGSIQPPGKFVTERWNLHCLSDTESAMPLLSRVPCFSSGSVRTPSRPFLPRSQFGMPRIVAVIIIVAGSELAVSLRPSGLYLWWNDQHQHQHQLCIVSCLSAVFKMNRIRQGIAGLVLVLSYIGLLRSMVMIHNNTNWTMMIRMILSQDVNTDEKEIDTRRSIDIVSMGSNTRPEYLEMQRQTFGLHESVRAFYPVTEANDTDASCSRSNGLTSDGVLDVIQFCNRTDTQTETNNPNSALSELMKRLFKPRRESGWLCAQKRPVEALSQLLFKYKAGLEIPQYVILTDDDTFLPNMESLNHLLREEYPPNVPFVLGACFIYAKDYSVPFGGFGSMFTRAAIKNMMHPIECSKKRGNSKDSRSRLSCAQLNANVMGEKYFFRNGMSVAELMYEYSAKQPFTNLSAWQSKGFCMHSDHALAYFINSYHIALPAQSTYQDPDRIHPLVVRHGYTRFKEEQCENKKTACNASNHVCHYIRPDAMKALFLERYDRQGATSNISTLGAPL
jgi:hypothetical protein